MTFGQIKKRALEQAGESAEDIAEYDGLLGAYVNEGYHELIRRAYKPKAKVMLPMEEESGSIAADMIPRLIEVTRVCVRGRSIPFIAGEQRIVPERGMLASQEHEAEVTYVHDEPELMQEKDAPRLPLWTHGALADYATWRFCMNGGAAQRSRAEFYFLRFREIFFRLRPQGEIGPEIGNMHGLHDCT